MNSFLVMSAPPTGLLSTKKAGLETGQQDGNPAPLSSIAATNADCRRGDRRNRLSHQEIFAAREEIKIL
jgi:hypothetical protein